MLTGASGFLGKAVLATMLARDPAPASLLVLLRAGDDAAATRRLETEVLASEPFTALPPRAVSDLLAAGRLRAVAGDIGAGRFGEAADWGSVDTVIHCAASVSFEEPLDTILALNSFGPVALLDSLLAAGADPHFVHVSTAYAADCSVDVVAEDGPLHPRLAELDPEELLARALAWRRAAETEGDDAEAKLARRGRLYANGLGWADTYALTKALGERLLCERSRRTTIVRPTIIESALSWPRPGWLEGIKVADPLVLAYAARGLTHLAGQAGNRIDVVPVDLVANACVAAALRPPSQPLRALALGSSARNPLTLGSFAGQIRLYFEGQPLRRRNGEEIAIGELRFVSRGRALRRAAARQRVAATAAALAPPSQRRRLRRQAGLASQVTRMVGIYAPYTELDCAFDDANARGLAAELSEEERASLPFDTAAIAWDDYLRGTHLPAVRSLAERRR